MRPSSSSARGRTSVLRVIFSTTWVVSTMKLGPTAAAERINRKKVDGQTAALAERKGPAAQHAVQAAQRSLVEERKQRSDSREHAHQLVQLEFEHQERAISCRRRFFSTMGRYSNVRTSR